MAAQVLMTKDTMTNDASRSNARNTFDELLKLGAVPVVNENDTVSTSEIPYVDNFGDNDRLSAIVSALIGADLLILLSDIDGLFTDDPRKNPEAKMIPFVPEITKELLSMGKETSGSGVGTGGMAAKLAAAQIATDSGSDMVIANADQVDVIYQIMAGKDVGTLFLAHKNKYFYHKAFAYFYNFVCENKIDLDVNSYTAEKRYKLFGCTILKIQRKYFKTKYYLFNIIRWSMLNGAKLSANFNKNDVNLIKLFTNGGHNA